MQQGPFAPRALPRFIANAGLAATVSSSIHFPVPPVIGRTLLPPISRSGRGRLPQLLSMPLSPCCPSHPAGEMCLISQSATHPAAFAWKEKAQPPRLNVSGPPMGSLTLRPGDSLTIPRMALSASFIRFVSSTDVTQATGR